MRVRIRSMMANSQTIQKIGPLILHVKCDGHRRAAVLNQREFEIKTLSNERRCSHLPEPCLSFA